ncbi:CDP-glycerol glycerophosphotransferase family protein [Actinomadura barringtoniae]|uniref:CDP-glycerol glycerophosphotransferase family protein n=1 Tax=Actinomadura barringtoniae TaxID=1427535 RepID=A0A939PG34_9ACTN|nr:CDP-glycerol glycerophosphotransferase family protein [Actinomadura barringtoniae]MBO2449448.1 CDP-glycerol glycerophosphotransferase family protein [Actinomadura barringtoniae]
MPARPDVSVVVIAYNDERRLPRAVGSVLAQSLGSVEAVVVDDASTDGTGETADRIAAAHPHRVRSFRLPSNSGGCGGPRNAGIERARGKYVMFLDSDDLLDPHACLNLLSAAEESDADLVSGLCARVHVGRHANKERPWYPWLYKNRAVYGSLKENTDLLYDTLSTNKAYRRGFLEEQDLRFVERLHYEDLLFSAEAYLSARRTALIPHRVYNWLVEPSGAASAPSISNRRAELANFADRLEIHRRIDTLFRRHDAADLKLAKDAKFVNHDLLLYLRELRSRDTVYRAAFLELAAGYLGELDPRVFEDAHAVPAIAAFLLRERDLPGALAAADYNRGRLPELRTDLVERDGRIYWGATPPQGDQARSVLDVTDLDFHRRPLSGLRLGNVVTRMRLDDGGRAVISGYVLNPLGRVPADAEIKARLELADRRRPGRVRRVRATVEHAGDRLLWRATFDPMRKVRPLGFADPVWTLRLRLVVNGETIQTFPGPQDDETEASTDGLSLPVRPRLTRLAADRMRSYVTSAGHVAFRLDGEGRLTRLSRGLVHRAAATSTGRRAWRRIRSVERAVKRKAGSRKTKVAVFNRVLTRLPVRKGSVVFESHLGKQYSDNPKYIYRELRRARLPVHATWSYASSSRGFPAEADLVQRGSWAYFLKLARAQFWVDNQGFPDGLRKRPETTYIQTWHGSALKLMGVDQPQLKSGTLAERKRLKRMVERYDGFLVRSQHDVDTLAKGLGVQSELLTTGYPRNDPLVTPDPDLERDVAALRAKLGLKHDKRRVVLYAPTFRKGPDGRPVRRIDPPIDLDRFARELGDDIVLLVRPHYFCTLALPPQGDGRRRSIIEVGNVQDVTLLLLLADTLVTDHSSIMFDYALLDRPMVFHLPDEQRLGRGYFDLIEEAPGPITRTEDELLAALVALPHQPAYTERRRAFARRFGEHDHGDAAKAVVDRYFKDRDFKEGSRRG